jgi:LAS superfamily LD-carboxypeptidase LdcB
MKSLVLIIAVLIVVSCKDQNHTVQVKSAELTQNEVIKKEVLDTMGLDYIMGKFDPKTHPKFTLIPNKYADRAGLYLRAEVLEAYLAMYDKAKAEGINFVIKSATRNFDYQKGIWERKWTGVTTLSDGTNLKNSTLSDADKALKILEYSSMPGTSRHHWGTDFDLNAFENDYFKTGKGKKEYDWLTDNGPTFGFVQVYTQKGPQRPDGYNEEKWHWSYKPIASQLLSEAKDYLTNNHIKGFKGAATAQEIDVVSKYILGVNKACY